MDVDLLEEKFMELLQERKQKKVSCEYDTVQQETMTKLMVDQETFDILIQNLTASERLTVSKRSGKSLFSLKEAPSPILKNIENTENNISMLRNDFEDFKKHIYSTLESPTTSAPVFGGGDIMFMKDLVAGKDNIISLLKEEIKYLRDQNSILIQQRHCCVSGQNSLIDSNKLKKSQSVADTKKSSHIATKEKISRVNDRNDDTQGSNKTYEKKSKNIDNDKKTEKNNNAKKKVTYIIGDSIVKEVKGWNLSNEENKIIVKPFSGAKTECMKSYIIPAKKADPDCVILHVGTNDLSTQLTDAEISTNIINLALELKTDNNAVIVSSLTLRNDKHGHRIDPINQLVKENCNSRNIGFIDNSNIMKTHLNRSNLHLNPNGTKLLGENYLFFING